MEAAIETPIMRNKSEVFEITPTLFLLFRTKQPDNTTTIKKLRQIRNGTI